MIPGLALALSLTASPTPQEEAELFSALWRDVGWSGPDSAYPGWALPFFTKVMPLSPQLLARIDALARAAGEPVFLSGPHQAGSLDLRSRRSFGHYNPRFVRWFIDRAVVGADSEVLRRSLAPIYEERVRKYARIFYGAYLRLATDEALREKLLEEYRQYMSRDEPKESFAYGMELPPIRHQPEFDNNVTPFATSFWLRRWMDGTAGIFAEGLERLLRVYDPDYLRVRPLFVAPPQFTLPVPETLPPESPLRLSFYMAITEAVPESFERDASALTVVNGAGLLCRGRLEQAGILPEPECCQEAPTPFLVATYSFPNDCPPDSPRIAVPLPLAREEVVLPGERTRTSSIPNALRDFAVPATWKVWEAVSRYETEPHRFRIRADSSGPVLEIRWSGGESLDSRPLGGCETQPFGKLQVLRCTERGKAPEHQYAWNFVLEGDDLVEVLQTGWSDDYDALPGIEPAPTLGYSSNGTMLYGFGPGTVLYEWSGFWWKSGPFELHYTGECDCEP